jgi:hypothetical protein
MSWQVKTAVLAALLPITVVHLAWALNVGSGGLAFCWPYWEGCTSVSRGIRSGPGLWLFKLAAVPMALCLAFSWRRLPPPLHGTSIRWLGTLGAVFMLVYALALGTDGAFYSWMRRFGVVFYFGCTGLAQLLVGAALANHRQLLPQGVRRRYFAVLGFTWAVGIVSAFKRRLFDDPAMVDQLQNSLEWWFALGLSLGFLALSRVIYHLQQPCELEISK